MPTQQGARGTVRMLQQAAPVQTSHLRAPCKRWQACTSARRDGTTAHPPPLLAPAGGAAGRTVEVVRVRVEAARLGDRRVEAEVAEADEAGPPKLEAAGHDLQAARSGAQQGEVGGRDSWLGAWPTGRVKWGVGRVGAWATGRSPRHGARPGPRQS